jgi:hypothetical protein
MIELIPDTLLASPAITALIGNRVKPVGSNQDEVLPYITFQSISDVPTRCREGIALETIRVQVTAFAASFRQCQDLYVAIRTALDGASNATASCEWMNANDLYRDEASAHGKAIDFQLITN